MLSDGEAEEGDESVCEEEPQHLMKGIHISGLSKVGHVPCMCAPCARRACRRCHVCVCVCACTCTCTCTYVCILEPLHNINFKKTT